MQKIFKLDPQLINQIAAGEVIERPISVVKELVENSLDAGADMIQVQIREGGKNFISVTDNGSGIEAEDLSRVLEKHATSKIKNLDDLFSVMTFGFRGEAIASIASVSDFIISSKTADQSSGYKLSYNNGVKSEVMPCPLQNGTKIELKDLFFNTPARKTYLKKDSTEKSHIMQFLQEMALGYPKVGFEFISDDKIVFQYAKNQSGEERIFQVYGEDFQSHALAIDFEFGGVKVSGCISDPKVSFTNKNRQVLFVNGRIIKSGLIFKAIGDAYRRYIPHGNYAGYILHLDLDPTQVDVNVHPRKMEVKFAQEQGVFRAFYHAISRSLEQVSLVQPVENKETSLSSGVRKIEHIAPAQFYTGSGTKFKSYSPYKNTASHPNQTNIFPQTSSGQTLDNESKQAGKDALGDLSQTPLGRIVGQLHNSYIIVETPQGIKILDQHALAERIIYEQLQKKETSTRSQGLLIPQHLSLTAGEYNLARQHEKIFLDMGFEIEFFPGNVMMIGAVPDILKSEKIDGIFLGIIKDIDKGNLEKFSSYEEVTSKIHAYTACRSAIKFGHRLTLLEMHTLLCNSVIGYTSTCPHGRPVVFDMNLDDLKNLYER